VYGALASGFSGLPDSRELTSFLISFDVIMISIGCLFCIFQPWGANNRFILGGIGEKFFVEKQITFIKKSKDVPGVYVGKI